jgi:hypothetical protein
MSVAVSVIALLAGGPGAGTSLARKSPSRTVRKAYAPNPEHEITVNYLSPGLSVTTVEFEPEPGHERIEVKLVDDNGGLVRGSIRQGNTFEEFCGETDGAVAVSAEAPFQVNVYSGPCGDEMSLPTEGMVEVTFSR